MRNIKKRIMFVDDEIKVLNGIRRSMAQRQKEWDMVFVSSALKALEQLSRSHIDVLVTDIAMPGISGLDLVRKTNDKYPSVQCIVLTGAADLKLAQQLINSASVYRFYTKPYNADLLGEGISDALETKEKEPSTTLSHNDGELERAILNKIPAGVLVASSDGRIEYMNQSAANTLSKTNAVSVGNKDVLKGRTPDQTKELLGLLKEIASSTSGETRGLTLSDPEKGEGLHLIVSGNRNNSLLIFITDPCEAPLPSARLIGELFQLTPSESNLAERLVKGDSIKEAAAIIGITEQSARTYLKNAMAKMSAKRQSELVGRILSTNLPK